MDKFEEWFKTYRPSLDTSAIEAEFIFEAGQQSRQTEIDQLQSQINEMAEVGLSQESELNKKDEYAHSLYYENANLQTLVEEKDKRINQALNFINNWWHPDLDQKLFVEALCRALRGAND